MTPAGYGVVAGWSFEKLVWFCAQMVTERDDQSWIAILEERIANKRSEILELRMRHDRLLEISDAQFESDEAEILQRIQQSNAETAKAWSAENAKLADMAERVRQWKAPGSSADLKEYLLQQLQDSRHRDPDGWLTARRAEIHKPRSRAKQAEKIRDEIADIQASLTDLERSLESQRQLVRDLEASVPRPTGV